MRRAFRFAQRNGQNLQVGICRQHSFAQLLILLALQVARFHIDVHMHVDAPLAVFFIGNANVHQLHQFGHHLARAFAPFPQVLAVIQIARNLDALRFGGVQAL